MTQFECVLDAHAAVGECPTWHAGEQRLYWIDSPTGRINRFDPVTGKNETRDLGYHIGSFAFRKTGGLIAATQRGFCFLDFDTGLLDLISDPESGRNDLTMNDGRAGPGGQFFAGSMGFPIRLDQLDGTFYRLDADGTVTALVGGMGTSNGLAFSPDGKTLYHADSLPCVQTIWAWDHDPASGGIENRRVFATTEELAGRPDGACVDAEGFYWSANVDGWQVVRYAPDGSIDRILAIPVQKPSMPCFGGPYLDILYVTSIGNGGSSPMAEGQPQAGGIFACQPGVKGLPEPFFAG
ncbi:MAG: SMP-30/gluconolactonase/LRE family protein [Rhodospirillaceae bacterium]|jgi:L-arabinonolactonase|nr:SMP-30/gluconolactonase/LRE family protein [Rhodospirillaceae bacterium]MBT6203576.1 SMP-30/gluconolactonase/LRE family protein [Rhodospirillaceae bacterium]MBT6510052.1 SMP-30/gluconolactonase/LRE family protein [Rhodospirillaceae bacterium]MBT7615373.1 SMP-30/gluconolactonase/LRE family protein [Rhodospirillaceae bacterium]MBT7646239.1 SMP-30/gluconolactonase/LRE family protein [Rhodospirillaceae bacterium]